MRYGFLFLLALCQLAPAAIQHEFIASDESGKQLIYVNEKTGKRWAKPVPRYARDLQLIGDGKLLHTTLTGFREYNIADGKITREVTVPGAKRIYSGFRLVDGRTLLVEAGSGKGYILNKAGKVAKTFCVGGNKLRLVRPTRRGTLLIGASDIKEVTLDGKVVRQFNWPDKSVKRVHLFKPVELANGNWASTIGYRPEYVEVTPPPLPGEAAKPAAGKIVKRNGFVDKLPKGKTNFYCDWQRLANGNLIANNWTGHKRQDSKNGPQLLEFDAAGKVVWTWDNPKFNGSLHTVIVIDGLDTSKIHSDALTGAHIPIDGSEFAEFKGGTDVAGAPATPAAAPAAKPTKATPSSATIQHEFIASDESGHQIIYVNEKTGKRWAKPMPRLSRDLQLIGDGKVMHTMLTGFREFKIADGTMTREVIIPGAKNIFTCYRFVDGRTMLIERTSGKGYFVDKADKIVGTFCIGQNDLRLARPTRRGTLLIGGYSFAKEITLSGQVLREWAWPNKADKKVHLFKIIEMPNGNWASTVGFRPEFVEFKPTPLPGRRAPKSAPKTKTEIVARRGYAPKLPAGQATFFYADWQRLENGNVVVANWLGHKKEDSKKGPQLLEFDDAGELVWTWNKPSFNGSIHTIIMLDGLDTSKIHSDAFAGKQAPIDGTEFGMIGDPGCDISFLGSSKIGILDRSGLFLRKYAGGGNVTDLRLLPNGNMLYTSPDVIEVTQAGEQVFRYAPRPAKGGVSFGCARLDDGRTVVAENLTGKIVFLDKAGNVESSFMTIPNPKGAHGHMRHLIVTPRKTIWVALKDAKQAREYTFDGKLLRTLKRNDGVFGVAERPNGNIVLGCLNGAYEYDKNDKVVWSMTKSEFPKGVVTGYMTGIRLRKNGNLVVGIYRAYSGTKGSAMVEVTKDKKVVWRYVNRETASTIMGFELLEK